MPTYTKNVRIAPVKLTIKNGGTDLRADDISADRLNHEHKF